MGNAQEAIEEYEAKKADVRKMDVNKTVTPHENKHISMILDFKYKDHSCFYLAQRIDGKQKWVRDPDPEIWKDHIYAYWNSTCSDSANDEP